MKDGVIILHGILRTNRSMKKLSSLLEKNGYQTLNLNYPSTKQTIEEIAQHLHPQIHEFATKTSGKIHFVGYSMGGLVIRAYLNRFSVERLGRIVMLATPNNGSEIADLVKNRWFFHKIYGPAGQQLVTKFENAEIIFGSVNYELGIIAGNRSINPICSLVIGKPSDGTVSINSTKLDGMKDHLVIPSSHTFFPRNKKALLQTLNFIENGSFNKKP